MNVGKPIRVLLVEDSIDDEFLLERELQRQGFQVALRRVDTQPALVAALKEEPWDIVLSDHTMPEFTSFGAVDTVRQAGLDLPVIVVSGSIGEESAVELMRTGAADWVSKERLARLGAVIERELTEAENRRQRREAEALVFDLNRDLQRRVTDFETLLRVIPIGIAVAEDPACRVIRCNPAFARILGTVPEANISLSAPPEDRPDIRFFYPGGDEIPVNELPMQVAVQQGRAVNQEMEVLAANGHRSVVYGSATPLYDESGQTRGAVGAFVDVTSLKQAESTLRSTEKLAMVGRLTATIAHEINNPLEAVGNILYLLCNTDGMQQQQRQMIQVAQQELQRIASIVRNTLAFYREPAQPTRIDLAELMDSVLSLYERKLSSSRVTVVRDFRTRGVVFGFPGELRQVFTNLVVNAADALGGTPGVLTLRIAPGTNAEGRRGTRITVADNGPGISAKYRNHIFEPFFTTKGEKGTGLGLWVTHGIVKKHGGSIWVRSTDWRHRHGTVFSIFLPEEMAVAHAGASDEAPVARAG